MEPKLSYMEHLMGWSCNMCQKKYWWLPTPSWCLSIEVDCLDSRI